MSYTIENNIAVKMLAEAEHALLNKIYQNGQDAFDTGTREDQIDYLLGLDQMAFGLAFCPSAMMEMKEYFQPAYDALIAEQQRHTQHDSQTSPFTGRPMTPRTSLSMPLGTAGAAPENAPVNGGPPSPSAPVKIPEGTFTIVHEDGVGYETIRIERVDNEGSNLFGKYIASHISGPDNTLNFTGFAFVNPDGSVKVWNKHVDIDPRWPNAVLTALSVDTDTQGHFREAYALRSGRCSRCGRELTVPASLFRGVGPDCARMI